MVNLVQISRAYDANQHVITTNDKQMQKELDELG
jgi:flagellar basal body rod protein FlgG